MNWNPIGPLFMPAAKDFPGLFGGDLAPQRIGDLLAGLVFGDRAGRLVPPRGLDQAAALAVHRQEIIMAGQTIDRRAGRLSAPNTDVDSSRVDLTLQMVEPRSYRWLNTSNNNSAPVLESWEIAEFVNEQQLRRDQVALQLQQAPPLSSPVATFMSKGGLVEIGVYLVEFPLMPGEPKDGIWRMKAIQAAGVWFAENDRDSYGAPFTVEDCSYRAGAW